MYLDLCEVNRPRVNINPYKDNFIRLLQETEIGEVKYVTKGTDGNKSYEPSDYISWSVAAFWLTYKTGEDTR